MILGEYIENQIKRLSLEKASEECCGLLIYDPLAKNTNIYPCENKSADKKNYFVISPTDYLKASRKGKIMAFYHSHPKGKLSSFSELDRQQAEAHKIISILYDVARDKFSQYEPNGYDSPYMGRAFKIGEQDCFTLAKDYYENELGITFGDFQRDENWSRDIESIVKKKMKDVGASPLESFKKNVDFLIKNEDFVKVHEKNPDLSDLNVHDALIFNYEGDTGISHFGVYLGGGNVLHQPSRACSRIQEYSAGLRHKTSYVLRHKSLA
jgi:proteasome lid subunit RPN8/RPN11